jgi:non-specific protein-tyrosine kinase
MDFSVSNDKPNNGNPTVACRTVVLDAKPLRRNRCIGFFTDAPGGDYYKLLRTQIVQRCQANNWRTIMITSAVPGEGKTLTAINLAVTFAKAFDQTSLLVDCDLQRQTVHRYLGAASRSGLADYLRNDTPLEEIIFRPVWPGVEQLAMISGGRPVSDHSAELISAPKMARLAAEMKARYPDRYIFFDLPPLLASADASAFAPMADCMIMVVHPKTSFDEVNDALDLVPKEKFMGFVLNALESPGHNYYGRYQYGYRQ